MSICRTLAATVLAGTLLVPAAGAQSRYQRWNKENDQSQQQQQLRQALDELDRLVGQAERARAADPRFLRDLKSLSQKYRAQVQAGATTAKPANGTYIADDFGDGDFTGNPPWSVVSGSFQVLADKKLISAVVLKADERKAAERDAGGNSGAGDAIGILSQILLGNQSNQGQTQPDMQASDGPAEIRTQAAIPNHFVLDVDMSSRTTQGAIEFVISQGDSIRPGYGLLYRTGDGLMLIRRGDTSYDTIARAAPRGALFDGLAHNIRWSRDTAGRMFVEIDGTRVMKLTDHALQDPFAGLSIINRGGVHLVHKVKVTKN